MKSVDIFNIYEVFAGIISFLSFVKFSADINRYNYYALPHHDHVHAYCQIEYVNARHNV
jgi:hypothetical protein